MKLELKHLAAYLPYGVRLVGCQSLLNTSIINRWENDSFDIDMILRPLSDLTKEIEVNGERFIPIEEILFTDDLFIMNEETHLNKYWVIQKLREWHFDIFGLIEQGLAVDINTLTI